MLEIIDVDFNRPEHGQLWLDELPDPLRDYAEHQWQRPSVRQWLARNAAARR